MGDDGAIACSRGRYSKGRLAGENILLMFSLSASASDGPRILTVLQQLKFRYANDSPGNQDQSYNAPCEAIGAVLLIR